MESMTVCGGANRMWIGGVVAVRLIWPWREPFFATELSLILLDDEDDDDKIILDKKKNDTLDIFLIWAFSKNIKFSLVWPEFNLGSV